jgi:molybdopterin-containing oxidoreductase family iron-sulfur binding subunit
MPPVNASARHVAALRGLLARSGERVSWQALERVAETPEFRDFVLANHPSLTPMLAGTGRRRVLQIMAASFALAGLGGGARAQEAGTAAIIPYVNQPENVTPGVPMSYASASLLDGIANGMLVTTIDGRPIKIEGNPDHPWSRGGTDAFSQAWVLGLYDPDRSQAVRRRSDFGDWDGVRTVLAKLRETHGQGVHLLTGPVTSPSLVAQIERARQVLPGLRWHVHAPTGRDSLYAGAEQVFGRPLETHWHFDKAEVIVSLDGDFLDPGPHQIGTSRRWIDARRQALKSGRLLAMHAVAPVPSLTFAKADHRRSAAQHELLTLATSLANPGQGGAADPWREAAAAALAGARGRSLVVTGTFQSAELHAAVHRLNAALGNIGQTVSYTEPVVAGAEPLATLTDAMRAGRVTALLMLDCNPVYTAPPDAAFAELLPKVPLKVHAGLHVDETAVQCDWHLPLSHSLESWGDARALDGTVTLLQPTIQPLYDGRSAIEILSMLVDRQPRAGLDLMQSVWRDHLSGDFDTAWRQALVAGFIPGSALPTRTVTPIGTTPVPPAVAAAVGLTAVVRPDPTVWDGTFANNPWLQELPKPLTKTVWQNVIGVAPDLAQRNHLRNGDIVTVHANRNWIAGPVWIQPGQDAETIALYLGYGRTSVGDVGSGIGYNTYPLRSQAETWLLTNVTLQPAKQHERVATLQQVDSEEGHDFVRLQRIGGKPVGDDTAFTQPTLYQRDPSDGRAWGMVIDLDSCIGCQTCVVACQAENNVPTVGKEEVLAGRDMHWLRVDRYFDPADAADPATRFMPVPCMHCETAPCELGCPVEATVHDSEGLNLMIYNRCIGTRACSAYCPYKVRHFNYLHYSEVRPPLPAQRNPSVTVRARGVMEKCTYCVQRIVAGRIAADRDHRAIRDGEVVTACAAACPTQAITFGDLADQSSAVASARRDPRNYALLGELNTRPRTTYLAAVTPSEEKA